MAKVKTDWIISELHGRVGQGTYFMKLDDEWSSIRRCPPSHRGDRYWQSHIKPATQDAENQKFKRVMERIRTIWQDPVQKAEWIERHRADPSLHKSSVPYQYMKSAIMAEEYPK